ncbi:hypothetical protein BWZ20_01745 [Winogradskyella sp. J14-2]|uniref:DUF4251 domain-containing protein n=1 Tax=Winogradskyella sp. J14-2 TaxID=1936080 RepID=UPI000972783C|nr:DUF4251 domain-containing protein [Winogradskyella sp. J14-2]APY07102.1 hypothetical protein BWZ20_01745 [Winogradskyella sp. J14-2]
MKKLIIYSLLLTIALPFTSFSQSVITKDQKVQAMYSINKKIVESQNYKFIASWVFNNDKRDQVSEGANTITITNANINGSLSTLETDKPSTTLKGSLLNYNVQFNDSSHEITITFKIGSYNAKLEVKSNGNAFLFLNSENKGTLKYKGFVK